MRLNFLKLMTFKSAAITTPLAIQQNSKECQFQNGGNCRSAYLSLNQKYENLLRKVNLNSKAIKNQVSHFLRVCNNIENNT